MVKTIYCKLVAIEYDLLGYTIYVFENLDSNSTLEKYIMTTRWPNWQHRKLDINEIGYLSFREVIEGVDTWFDGNKMIPYNYTNIIFIKFIQKKEDNFNKDIIL